MTLVSTIALWFNPTPHDHPAKHDAPAASSARSGFGPLVLLLFAFLLFTRMTVQATTTTFLPKFLQDQGWTPGSYGVAASMLMIGSAIGNVVGGKLADRIGRRKVVAGSLLLAALPLWFYLQAAPPWLHILIFLIGFLTGAGFSVTVVMAQALLPGRQALASGLTLGFIFASGAVGATIAGWVSDQIGLAVVLRGMALVAIISSLSALPLPSTVQKAPQ
ncbi:MAG: MFS transporter [Chloroflexi bacterium]|nr:MFS transporter [Chloroflexota bacterium]